MKKRPSIETPECPIEEEEEKEERRNLRSRARGARWGSPMDSQRSIYALASLFVFCYVRGRRSVIRLFEGEWVYTGVALRWLSEKERAVGWGMTTTSGRRAQG